MHMRYYNIQKQKVLYKMNNSQNLKLISQDYLNTKKKQLKRITLNQKDLNSLFDMIKQFKKFDLEKHYQFLALLGRLNIT